jgi:hypothetical protein
VLTFLLWGMFGLFFSFLFGSAGRLDDFRCSRFFLFTFCTVWLTPVSRPLVLYGLKPLSSVVVALQRG